MDFDLENNDKNHKLKVGDYLRISIYKNIFAKVYTPSCSEEVFAIRKVKNTVLWTYVRENLNGEEILERSMKNNCKKQIKNNLELKKQ